MSSSMKISCLCAALGILSFVPLVLGQDSAKATIVDQRSADSLKGHRDSNFSAIAFLPEKAVKPAPIAQLQDALSKRANQPVSLVISEMRVMDYFPKRIKAGPSGWLNNAIMQGLVNSKTDWSFVDGLGINNEENSVICLLAGTVNGKEIKVAAYAPYELGGFSVMVRSDKNFKAAVASSIDQVAQKIIEQSTVTQAAW